MKSNKVLVVGANGYIGSRLAEEMSRMDFDLALLDSGLRNGYRQLDNRVRVIDSRDLSSKELNEYKFCVWLGGHSSVIQSIEDPVGCVHNNLLGLIELNEKYNGKLIYASSGSVYSCDGYFYSKETDQLTDPLNVYDYSKIAFDKYMQLEGKNYVGLRFGTVVGGGSLNPRNELLLNKMVHDAVIEKKIDLYNENAVRPILWLEDLVKCIIKMVSSDIGCGIYNLANLNASMGYYAERVANKFNADIVNHGNSKTYNFMMDVSKFETEFSYEFEKDIDHIITDIFNGMS